jgi:hypothetical protein
MMDIDVDTMATITASMMIMEMLAKIVLVYAKVERKMNSKIQTELKVQAEIKKSMEMKMQTDCAAPTTSRLGRVRRLRRSDNKTTVPTALPHQQHQRHQQEHVDYAHSKDMPTASPRICTTPQRVGSGRVGSHPPSAPAGMPRARPCGRRAG